MKVERRGIFDEKAWMLKTDVENAGTDIKLFATKELAAKVMDRTLEIWIQGDIESGMTKEEVEKDVSRTNESISYGDGCEAYIEELEVIG